MTDSESNGKKGKGFAGLDSMVSDVSEDVEKTAKAAPPKTPPSEPPPSQLSPQPARPEPRPAPAKSSPPTGSGKSGLGWVIAGLVVLVIWIANYGSGNKSQLTQSYSPPPSYSAPAPAPAPAAAPAPAPAAAPVSDEQKPPVGRDNVLNIPQIRWCKREEIRIEAIESVINNAYEHEVDRFNAKVSDYNSRCGEFRYRRGNVEQVDRELASERESIASRAKSEWVRKSLGLKDGTAAAPRKEKPPAATKPKPALTPACQNDMHCPGSQYCVQGKCVGDSGSASSLTPPPAPAPREKPRSSMPANAKIDVYGTGWECERGYKRSGNECDQIRLPANAKIDVYGHDWECERGYKRSGNECNQVRLPANAKIDVYGHDWECERGYKRSGNECRPL